MCADLFVHVDLCADMCMDQESATFTVMSIVEQGFFFGGGRKILTISLIDHSGQVH